MTRRKIRAQCPRCRSLHLALTEIGTDEARFIQGPDGSLDPEAILTPGDPFKVIAACLKCRHRWTVRGAIQITDIHVLAD